MCKLRHYLLLLFFLSALHLQADESGAGSVRVSLLTCSPGSELYSLFGHTAIRYVDDARGIDYVFNYGVFSFDEPHFYWRFVKGETDYSIGVNHYSSFVDEYMQRGSLVIEQELNLTDDEKMALAHLLDVNMQPRNRIYRYNYFYDNCTTRARDIIERSIKGSIDYSEYEAMKDSSYRELVHRFTAGYEWSEFGIDLLIGGGSDRAISHRESMFLPDKLHEAFSNAIIVQPDGTRRPLVSREVRTDPNHRLVQVMDDFPLSPYLFFVMVLILTVVLSLMELVLKKLFWLWDILLYGAQGLIGCVIAFLFFFSTHPTVGTNVLIVAFNPLPLFFLPRMVCLMRKRRFDLYHWIAAPLLFLFLIGSFFMEQQINVATYYLICALLFRSLFHILRVRFYGVKKSEIPPSR